MASGLQTDTQVMANAATRAAEIAGQISSTTETMSTQLSMLGTAWVGAGGTAFHNAHEALRSDMLQINGALGRLVEMLSRIGSGYTTADEETQQTVSRSAAEAGTITAALKF
ncbi:WXG100 family type VII secretion target [Micromonospora sp. NPDC003197]